MTIPTVGEGAYKTKNFSNLGYRASLDTARVTVIRVIQWPASSSPTSYRKKHRSPRRYTNKRSARHSRNENITCWDCLCAPYTLRYDLLRRVPAHVVPETTSYEY